MRKAALALLGIGGIVVALLLLRSEGARGSSVAPAREPERQPSSAVADDLVAAETPAEGERAPVDIPASSVAAPQPRPAEESPADPTPVAAGLHLAGTIVVNDAEGVEHADASGRFSFMLWSEDRASGHRVDVEKGRWKTTLPRDVPCKALSVVDVHLDERLAVSEGDPQQRIALPADGWLELRVRWAPACILSVRDRRSGRELDPVLLTEAPEWPASEYGHPGDAANEARDLGASPIVVPPSEWLSGRRALFVRSPGYGWGRIEIDEALGGERIILLEPAGELEVLVTGTVTDPGTELRLYGAAFSPVFAASLVGSPTVLVEALAQGSYRVKAEIGDVWDERLVLGETTAEVVAGARSRVTLELKSVPAVEDVPLAGLLVIPAEWDIEDFRLDFEFLDTTLGGRESHFTIERARMDIQGLPDGTHHWRTRVQPGRYNVGISTSGWTDLGFNVVLEVPPVGLEDARIEIPPPCTVAVRCVDDENGEEIAVERVYWTGAPTGVTFLAADWNASTRRWEFVAPRGELQCGAWSNTLERSPTTFVANAGHNEVELRVKHATGLDLVVREGDKVFAWQDDWTAQIHPADGQAEGQSWCWSGKVRAREPGRYRLEFGEVPGYEVVPPLVVELSKGVVKEQVIELHRLP